MFAAKTRATRVIGSARAELSSLAGHRAAA